ncbi:MAG: malonyl CoA-acyl carrier protein transacylase, partial [Pseudomonadota bacterium]|nr:malonyl CoA-acyl carrier protein transacylase [Pseudomonadota bacterium]
DVNVVMPQTTVIQNVHAQPAASVEELRTNLVAQLSAPVRWTETIEKLVAEGVDQFIEAGPGNVLSGLVKRIARGTPTIALSSAAGLTTAIAL